MKTKPADKFICAEMHCHTVWSLDSGTHLPDLLKAARERGIQKLAITDHNTIDGALAARELEPDLVVVGEEIRTTGGELLAYFVSEEVPARLPLMEAIERLKRQGAVIAIPHPLDVRRHGWRERDLREILPHVDALEVFNARCLTNEVNRRAQRFACEVGLPGFAGSDAHSLVELGLGVTWLPDFSSADELRASLQQVRWEGKRLSAGQHLHASLKIVLGRLYPHKKAG